MQIVGQHRADEGNLRRGTGSPGPPALSPAMAIRSHSPFGPPNHALAPSGQPKAEKGKRSVPAEGLTMGVRRPRPGPASHGHTPQHAPPSSHSASSRRAQAGPQSIESLSPPSPRSHCHGRWDEGLGPHGPLCPSPWPTPCSPSCSSRLPAPGANVHHFASPTAKSLPRSREGLQYLRGSGAQNGAFPCRRP